MWIIAIVVAAILAGCQYRPEKPIAAPNAAPSGDSWVSMGRELRNRGKYPWREEMRLKDAILLAGGLSDFASGGVFWIYHGDGTIDKYPVSEVMAPNGTNPLLKPGDHVNVVTSFF